MESRPGVIKDSNKYVAKCANVANVPMNAKISYKFSSNTDDGVGYGVWVAFADYTQFTMILYLMLILLSGLKYKRLNTQDPSQKQS